MNIQDKNMKEQKVVLKQNIENWMAHKNSKGHKYEQIDDILVIGVRY